MSASLGADVDDQALDLLDPATRTLGQRLVAPIEPLPGRTSKLDATRLTRRDLFLCQRDFAAEQMFGLLGLRYQDVREPPPKHDQVGDGERAEERELQPRRPTEAERTEQSDRQRAGADQREPEVRHDHRLCAEQPDAEHDPSPPRHPLPPKSASVQNAPSVSGLRTSAGAAPGTLNGDATKRASADTRAMDWTPSPSGSVWRKRLHLVGGAESGQVTSVVRYLPDSRFPAHDHPEGEEILVLEGTFSDEHGDWPAGTHLLNPEGFHHAPFSREGCVLFVKLRQYAGSGREYRKTDTRALAWQSSDRAGVETKPLYAHSGFPDRTCLERWAAGAVPDPIGAEGGLEIFVIEGSFQEGDSHHGAGAWLRLPAGASLPARSSEGCVLYVKRGAVSTLRSG